MLLSVDESGNLLPSPVSLQVEWRDAGEGVELREEQEDEWLESRAAGRRSSDGMQSHDSRSVNLELLSISRTLSSPAVSSFSSAVWNKHEVLGSDTRRPDVFGSRDIVTHLLGC